MFCLPPRELLDPDFVSMILGYLRCLHCFMKNLSWPKDKKKYQTSPRAHSIPSLWPSEQRHKNLIWGRKLEQTLRETKELGWI